MGNCVLYFGITKPVDREHLFSPWLRSFSNRQRNLVFVGVAAFCWALWICRNDVAFQKAQSKSILQVIFRVTFWIRSWFILFREEGRLILKEGCRVLEFVALEIIHKSGWNVLRRIENSFDGFMVCCVCGATILYGVWGSLVAIRWWCVSFLYCSLAATTWLTVGHR